MLRCALGLAVAWLGAGCSLVFGEDESARAGLPEGVEAELRFDFEDAADVVVSKGTIEMALTLNGNAQLHDGALDLSDLGDARDARALASSTAEDLVNQCQRTRGFSISTWVTPTGSRDVDGLPARIVSLENRGGTEQTNFMVGQGAVFPDAFDAMTVRVGETDQGQLVEIRGIDIRRAQPMWVGFSMDSSGYYTMIVDDDTSFIDAELTVDDWSPDYRLSLGAANNGERQWEGLIHHVDILCTALTEEQLRELSEATAP